MPTFFSGGAVGRTVSCKDENTQGTAAFVSPNPSIGWQSQKSIITRITIGYQGNYQFLHTIGNDIYIYVFGDRIGQLTISGLSMAADCTRLGEPKHGFELIMEWYMTNRVANRKAPITVTVGRTPIEGFVVSLQGDAVDPATRLVQYGLQMVVLPEKAVRQSGDSSSTSGGAEEEATNEPYDYAAAAPSNTTWDEASHSYVPKG